MSTNKSQTLSNDILMRSIKIIDIGYITVLYFTFSVILAMLTDKIMGKFNPDIEKQKSILRLTIEMVVTIWMYGVLIYIVRNIVGAIPFPLDTYHGFDHKKVKELNSAMVFTFTYVLFSNYIKSKLLFYYNYLTPKQL